MLDLQVQLLPQHQKKIIKVVNLQRKQLYLKIMDSLDLKKKTKKSIYSTNKKQLNQNNLQKNNS